MSTLNTLSDVTTLFEADGDVLVRAGATNLFKNQPFYQVSTAFYEQPSVKLYMCHYRFVQPHDVVDLAIECISGSGTASGIIRASGGGDTAITGITGVAFSSTPGTFTATAANVIAVGDSLLLSVLTAASAIDLSFSFKLLRKFS